MRSDIDLLYVKEIRVIKRHFSGRQFQTVSFTFCNGNDEEVTVTAFSSGNADIEITQQPDWFDPLESSSPRLPGEELSYNPWDRQREQPTPEPNDQLTSTATDPHSKEQEQ